MPIADPSPVAAAHNQGRGTSATDFTSDDQVAITPGDTSSSDFPKCRAIWVGVAGNIKIVNGAGREVTIPNAPVGVLPFKATRVFATGTIASSLFAIY